MGENFLKPENYYDNYRGWDLRLMYERLTKLDIPSEMRQKIVEKENAVLLVLGSAVAENVHQISKIDSFLRPGKVEQDEVVIIDQNMYPLKKHQKMVDFIEGKDGWGNVPRTSNDFPYPKFSMVQADMRKLPFAEGKVDIVISDYTLNYLANIDDVDATFSEMSRALAEGGLVVLSVRGNEKYPLNNNEGHQSDDLQSMDQGGVEVHQFPLKTYIEKAQRSGLRLVAHNETGTDMCGVFAREKQR